jgi:hypothetical protein
MGRIVEELGDLLFVMGRLGGREMIEQGPAASLGFGEGLVFGDPADELGFGAEQQGA